MNILCVCVFVIVGISTSTAPSHRQCCHLSFFCYHSHFTMCVLAIVLTCKICKHVLYNMLKSMWSMLMYWYGSVLYIYIYCFVFISFALLHMEYIIHFIGYFVCKKKEEEKKLNKRQLFRTIHQRHHP